MSQKSSAPVVGPRTAGAKPPAEQVVRDIRRVTRKQHSSEEKIRIVLEGLRGEESIAALCRREGIAESLYYAWMLLCRSSGTGTRTRRPLPAAEIAVDLARDEALEAADDLRLALPFGRPPADVVERRAMAAHAGDHDAV